MRIYILSLGCAKNKVDSECLAGELKRAGHTLVDDVSLAEIGIVNTCGFIRPAVEESVSAILDLEQLKHEGKLKKIGVVGCLVNRYSEEMNEDLPEVDFWADSEEWDKVLAYLGNEEKLGRFRTNLPLSSKHTRYLKISEGCNNHCTFCTIPSIRGDLRSLPIKMLVSEAEQLVSEGARELCLVGQDLTVYGTDIYSKSSFIELLDALESSLPKDIWIRLLYLHPARVTTQLLERISSGRQVLPYLDVPIQHGDSRILSAMNRGMSDAELLAIFKKAREINPDFALRTTCMVGFPGEKKQHFDKMIDFISEVQFDRMGAFTFFAEEGTKAYEMPGQVAEATKKKRLNALMAVQEEISFKRQQLFVGKEVDVLLENVEWEYGFAEGRSFREAPEVDGLIEIRNIREDLKVGDIIKVQLKEAMPHDMVGEEVKK